MAKGARRPKSKFAAILSPGQLIEVVFYYKRTRNVQTLSEASYEQMLSTFRTDMEKMAMVGSVTELVDHAVHDNEENRELFQFLQKFLVWLHHQPAVSGLLFPYVQMRLGERIGIGLQTGMEQVPPRGGYLNVETGWISPDPEDDHSIRLTPKQTLFVVEALTTRKPSIFDHKLSTNEQKELITALDRYLGYHLGGMKPRRSDTIFHQLLNG